MIPTHWVFTEAVVDDAGRIGVVNDDAADFVAKLHNIASKTWDARALHGAFRHPMGALHREVRNSILAEILHREAAMQLEAYERGYMLDVRPVIGSLPLKFCSYCERLCHPSTTACEFHRMCRELQGDQLLPGRIDREPAVTMSMPSTQHSAD